MTQHALDRTADRDRRARKRDRRRGQAREAARRYGRREKVVAPRAFSFVTNTDEVAAFYSEIRRKATSSSNLRRRVFVDFQYVEEATLDAFTALVCIAYDLHHEHGVQFALGQIPDERVEKLTFKSGFHALVTRDADALAQSTSGRFARMRSDRVDPEEAERQVLFAAKRLFPSAFDSSGRPPPHVRHKMQASIRTLIECMSNTKGHASAHGGAHEDWWLSVYYDRDARAVEFSFVDNGVGILKSGNVDRYRKLRAVVQGRTSADLLQDALDGKVPSKTGQSGRGEGLPTMQLDCVDHRLIDGLVVVANEAKVEVARRVHTVLRNGFAGTFIHWRITDTEGES